MKNSIKSLRAVGCDKTMFELRDCKADWLSRMHCDGREEMQQCRDRVQEATVVVENVHLKLSPAVSYLYNALSTGFSEHQQIVIFFQFNLRHSNLQLIFSRMGRLFRFLFFKSISIIGMQSALSVETIGGSEKSLVEQPELKPWKMKLLQSRLSLNVLIFPSTI